MIQTLRIAFIGAGAVNFGGGEGPWDHASRLEKIPGLQVVGVADRVKVAAETKLAARQHPMYAEAQVFAEAGEMLARTQPDAVWIGLPPNGHGTAEAGLDLELQCARSGVHMFVEKPLSAFRPERVQPVRDAIAASQVMAAVGYMFRYSQAVDTMRRILEETGCTPKVFMGRYNCAYSEIRKAEWWDVRQSGGPIVEQATHFVDLARFLVGDVDLQNVQAVAIRGTDAMGRLEDVPCNAAGERLDAGVDPAYRHPCATAATWKYTSGAVGSLTHGTLLHGEKYESELELWADGLRLVLMDPYGDCRLRVRRPQSEITEEIRFDKDDPYLTEDQVFVDALRTGERDRIRSTYADAFQTHALTWAITDAAVGR